jgi:hypothetical protein
MSTGKDTAIAVLERIKRLPTPMMREDELRALESELVMMSKRKQGRHDPWEDRMPRMRRSIT